MDVTEEEQNVHLSRRNFLGDVSAIGLGAIAANTLYTADAAAQTALTNTETETI